MAQRLCAVSLLNCCEPENKSSGSNVSRLWAPMDQLCRVNLKSRQRQLADCSSPTCSFDNHSTRSSWINSNDLKYPPTAVGGIRNLILGIGL